MPKLRNCRNWFRKIALECRNAKTDKIAKTAETAETFIIKFLHSFGIVYYKILIQLLHVTPLMMQIKDYNQII